MDPWMDYEVRHRSRELIADAKQKRRARLNPRPLRRGLRTRVASGAQALSNMLAIFARTLREQEL